MSRIKNKDTKPEIFVRKFLHSKGLRYRLHDAKLPGKPDLIFPKFRTILFIHGCFWHGHNKCKYYVVPKTRTEWWKEKINTNIVRDAKNIKSLTELGWQVKIVWECQLKPDSREKTLLSLLDEIKSSDLNEFY